jgi:hypothetical protein
LFRSNTFSEAASYFGKLAQLGDWVTFEFASLDAAVTNEHWAALVIGILGATPLFRWIANRLLAKQDDGGWSIRPWGVAAVLSLFVVTAMKLASSTFNPFIYYRF